ncbi:MBL fold metallo-hydrolase [Chelativorans sp. Marseille-P2723]|uniref:MBL fold metallo-hydrolase n=1 Tax=Chelativorans sp. Marseille-P2723 TaxID=2709133 RepID=UPI00156E2F5C|nr:MBL fold metallo-hydrolase [Chelativorans sp. Marseille-P2723]
MQIGLLGGFAEKGRTSVGICTGGCSIMLDAGIKVGAAGAEYYPALDRSPGEIDALFITHAHEDHVGALGWLLAGGFRGPVFMTKETAQEAPATLTQYALEEHADLFTTAQVEIFQPGDRLEFGDITADTGLSGHVAGGVWFCVRHEDGVVSYCGDVVPDSAVFRMDEVPACDLLLLDASYGADRITGRDRARSIAAWIKEHPRGCLLPTPLSGRSLELIASIPGPFAIHHEMRQGLELQLTSEDAFRPGMRDMVATKLSSAMDWREDEELPAMPLICHDGMGASGPSSRLLPRADSAGYPILLTGHLPAGSPGARLQEHGRAGWIRMPTHPTLTGNKAIWEAAGCPAAIGHSCPVNGLEELSREIPALRPQCATGGTLHLEKGALR